MTEDIFIALAESPRIVERLLRVFPSDRLDDSGPNGRPSPREIVALLADAEQLVLDRIRQANLRPGTSATWYDPNDRSSEHHFNDKDVFHEAEVYDSRRQMTLDYLREMKDADFDKQIAFDNKGSFSIGEYLSLILSHDIDRIGHLTSYMATEVATIS